METEGLRRQLEQLSDTLGHVDLDSPPRSLTARDVATLQAALAHTDALLRHLLLPPCAADTLASVAAQTGMSIAELREWNPSLATVGEREPLAPNTFLCVRPLPRPPPPPSPPQDPRRNVGAESSHDPCPSGEPRPRPSSDYPSRRGAERSLSPPTPPPDAAGSPARTVASPSTASGPPLPLVAATGASTPTRGSRRGGPGRDARTPRSSSPGSARGRLPTPSEDGTVFSGSPDRRAMGAEGRGGFGPGERSVEGSVGSSAPPPCAPTPTGSTPTRALPASCATPVRPTARTPSPPSPAPHYPQGGRGAAAGEGGEAVPAAPTSAQDRPVHDEEPTSRGLAGRRKGGSPPASRRPATAAARALAAHPTTLRSPPSRVGGGVSGDSLTVMLTRGPSGSSGRASPSSQGLRSPSHMSGGGKADRVVPSPGKTAVDPPVDREPGAERRLARAPHPGSPVRVPSSSLTAVSASSSEGRSSHTPSRVRAAREAGPGRRLAEELAEADADSFMSAAVPAPTRGVPPAAGPVSVGSRSGSARSPTMGAEDGAGAASLGRAGSSTHELTPPRRWAAAGQGRLSDGEGSVPHRASRHVHPGELDGEGPDEDEGESSPGSAVPASLAGYYYASNRAPTVHHRGERPGKWLAYVQSSMADVTGVQQHPTAADVAAAVARVTSRSPERRGTPPAPAASTSVDEGGSGTRVSCQNGGSPPPRPPPPSTPTPSPLRLAKQPEAVDPHLSTATSSTFISEPPSLTERSPGPAVDPTRAHPRASPRHTAASPQRSLSPTEASGAGEGMGAGHRAEQSAPSPPPPLSSPPPRHARDRVLDRPLRRSSSAPVVDSVGAALVPARDTLVGAGAGEGSASAAGGVGMPGEDRGSATASERGRGDGSFEEGAYAPGEGVEDNDEEDDEEYDTIVGIAEAYGVSVEEVVQWNPYLAAYAPTEPLPPDMPIVLPMPDEGGQEEGAW